MKFRKVVLASCIVATNFCNFPSFAVATDFSLTNSGFVNGMEVGDAFRGLPAGDYNIQQVLNAHVNPKFKKIEDVLKNMLTAPYEQYMCGIETRLIKTPNEYLYVHESIGAKNRFIELVQAMTPGLEINSPLVRRLIGTWNQVDQQKKYRLNNRPFISSEHIAELFQNLQKVYEGMLQYKTGDNFPKHVGFMDFDDNWKICNQYQIASDSIFHVKTNGTLSESQKKLLEDKFALDDVLCAQRSNSMKNPTAYEQWLNSFKNTSNFENEKIYELDEITQKASNLVGSVTENSAKWSEDIFQNIKRVANDENYDVISYSGKKYHKVSTVDFMVEKLRKICEVRRKLVEEVSKTFLDDVKWTQTGDMVLTYTIPQKRTEELLIEDEQGFFKQLIVERNSKGSNMDFASQIPGYDKMNPTKQKKAREKLQLQQSQMNNNK